MSIFKYKIKLKKDPILFELDFQWSKVESLGIKFDFKEIEFRLKKFPFQSPNELAEDHGLMNSTKFIV